MASLWFIFVLSKQTSSACINQSNNILSAGSETDKSRGRRRQARAGSTLLYSLRVSVMLLIIFMGL